MVIHSVNQTYVILDCPTVVHDAYACNIFNTKVFYPVQVQEGNTVPDTIPNNKTPIYVGLRRRAMTGVDDLPRIIWGVHQDHVHLQASHPMGESHGTESTAATM